jgi:hypothetical protein
MIPRRSWHISKSSLVGTLTACMCSWGPCTTCCCAYAGSQADNQPRLSRNGCTSGMLFSYCSCRAAHLHVAAAPAAVCRLACCWLHVSMVVRCCQACRHQLACKHLAVFPAGSKDPAAQYLRHTSCQAAPQPWCMCCCRACSYQLTCNQHSIKFCSSAYMPPASTSRRACKQHSTAFYIEYTCASIGSTIPRTTCSLS